MLELAYENMVNSLRTWENKYLIKSRHDGIVVWGKSWGMSHRVNEGDTLCTVISKQQANPLGHIRLSQDEVAEVAVGDKVNIELNKYPTHSYGVLPGKIAGPEKPPILLAITGFFVFRSIRIPSSVFTREMPSAPAFSQLSPSS